MYSLFLWIFLPYYVRTGLYTVPQFLERRYDVACRSIFSGSLIAGYIGAIIAGSLFAGGVALDSMLGLPVAWGIVFFGLATGAYTIYGGLRAAAWTDFLQVVVLAAGGVLVPGLGLYHPRGVFPPVPRYPRQVPGVPP